MRILSPLGNDLAQETLSLMLRARPEYDETPLGELKFLGRRYITLLYEAFATHPDYAGGDPSHIILRWWQAGKSIAVAESERLVDWFCATHPMRARRIERDVKIKLRKQGWRV